MELRDWKKLLTPWRAAGPSGYVSDPDELVGGNRVKLLHDGKEAFPEMLDAIASAKESVNLETYILRDDKTGRKFVDALSERAAKGIIVRLIFDAVGSYTLSSRFIQHLRNRGVQILEYHPVAPWRPRWAWGRRDHRKILVVDGKIAFAGGLNIGDNYAPAEEGGAGWRDMHVRVDGPAAHELERIFRSTWFKNTGRWFPAEGSRADKTGDSLVHVAANQEFLKRRFIRKAFIHAIERARRRISIAVAYFIPDRGIRRALYDAVKRDVKVEILVPKLSDVPAVSYASQYLYERHLLRGLRLYEWPGPTLHAKTIAVDRIWASIGSYNITHRSLMHNLEVNLHVLDRRFAGELDDAIREDIAESAELHLDDWNTRPYWDRVRERFFWLLRYWF
jgi:cardiolipin synthase